MDLKTIMKGIALIEKGTENPLVRSALTGLLPTFGVSPEDMATLDAHHADYQRWLKDAEDVVHGNKA